MFSLFRSKDDRRSANLGASFDSEVLVIQSMGFDERIRVLALAGGIISDSRKGIVGDIHALTGRDAERFVSEAKHLVHEVMKEKPLLGHAFTILGIYVEAAIVGGDVGAHIRNEFGRLLREAEREAANLIQDHGRR